VRGEHHGRAYPMDLKGDKAISKVGQLAEDAVRDIGNALTALLADMFALT